MKTRCGNCPVKVTFLTYGQVTVKSSELIQCCRVQKQLQALKDMTKKRNIESTDLETGLRKKDHFHIPKNREKQRNICPACDGFGVLLSMKVCYKCSGEGEIWV